MAFTAQDVKTLRERTGCGMMDCKKALGESGGDMEKAIEFLREKGLAAAAKKSGRVAAEGIVTAVVEGNVGVVLEVNAETDFVAKNDQFLNMVDSFAKTIIAANPADVDALAECKVVGSDNTVAEVLRENILTIGENMKIRRFARYEGNVVTYTHGGGRIGVMVKFDTDVASHADFTAFGKDIAMQIAAVNPAYLDQSVVPAEVVAKEKEILMAQIANDEKLKNKPAQVIEKMVEGRIGKYYKENCLNEQVFVKDSDLTIAQYVANKAKEFGGNISIVEFVRFEKGEGIEKKEDDFAAEVASMVK